MLLQEGGFTAVVKEADLFLNIVKIKFKVYYPEIFLIIIVPRVIKWL